jgi:hypothetical protein
MTCLISAGIGHRHQPSIGTSIVLAIPLALFFAFIQSILALAIKDFFGFRIFTSGDNDWGYMNYFFSYPLAIPFFLRFGSNRSNKSEP